MLDGRDDTVVAKRRCWYFQAGIVGLGCQGQGRVPHAGPRVLPSMNVAIRGQQLGAWENLKKFEKPFLSLIGLKDTLLGRPKIQEKWVAKVPGAKGQNHEQFENANHFIQEDIGEIMADRTHQFMQKNPL